MQEDFVDEHFVSRQRENVPSFYALDARIRNRQVNHKNAKEED
jgi:hypothetical protein